MQLKVHRICSILVYRIITSKISIQDGIRSCCKQAKCLRKPYWKVCTDDKDTKFQKPGMRECRREDWSKVKKGEMSARKEKWEDAFSGRQLDRVRKGILVFFF